MWADRFYLGWIFRTFAQPRVLIPPFWSGSQITLADLEVWRKNAGASCALESARASKVVARCWLARLPGHAESGLLIASI